MAGHGERSRVQPMMTGLGFFTAAAF